ncbi:MAG TPA: hypothetical protein DF783_06995 [Acidimicrobiaceae bacterium]|nr:hypothetical protein [Acidimicrobiaceae bacterium]
MKLLRSSVERRFNEPVIEEAQEEAVEEADEGPIAD